MEGSRFLGVESVDGVWSLSVYLKVSIKLMGIKIILLSLM